MNQNINSFFLLMGLYCCHGNCQCRIKSVNWILNKLTWEKNRFDKSNYKCICTILTFVILGVKGKGRGRGQIQFSQTFCPKNRIFCHHINFSFSLVSIELYFNDQTISWIYLTKVITSLKKRPCHTMFINHFNHGQIHIYSPLVARGLRYFSTQKS